MICARIAAEPHWFGGERRVALHIVNSGFILGEVMRRVDGRTPRQFLRRGAGRAYRHRHSASMETWKRWRRPAFSAARSADGEVDPTALRMMLSMSKGASGSPVKGAQFPSGNLRSATAGQSPAWPRSSPMAACWTASATSAKRSFREAFAEQVVGDCPLSGAMRLGLLVALDHPGFPMPSPTSAYWAAQAARSA